MISINCIYNYFFQLPNQTTAEENKKDFITENCRACREIRDSFHTHDPGEPPQCPTGIFDVLRGFPWSCLGPRKVVQGKIDEIQQQSAAKAKKALIIEANGGWTDFPLLSDIPKIRCLAQTHSIEYYPISSQEDFFRMLKKLPKERLYDCLWIRGHGNQTGVFLGKLHFMQHMNRYKTLHFPYHIQILAEKIRKGGKVIFESCNVGSGKMNCAKSFSRLCPDTTVYASKTLHHAIWGLTMRSNGIPHFKSPFGFTSTRIYQRGRKIVSSPINFDGANRQSEGPLPEAQADARGKSPRTAPTSLPPL